jgi:hypothetical protein
MYFCDENFGKVEVVDAQLNIQLELCPYKIRGSIIHITTSLGYIIIN